MGIGRKATDQRTGPLSKISGYATAIIRLLCRGYMWNKIISILFRPSSMSRLKQFCRILFQRLIAAREYFPTCSTSPNWFRHNFGGRNNNSEIISVSYFTRGIRLHLCRRHLYHDDLVDWQPRCSDCSTGCANNTAPVVVAAAAANTVDVSRSQSGGSQCDRRDSETSAYIVHRDHDDPTVRAPFYHYRAPPDVRRVILLPPRLSNTL